MNTSMFLPQVAEVDLYDSQGNQLDDVNSVIEYFQVALGYDHHADDEDDDNGQNFHLVKNIEYNFQQVITLAENKPNYPLPALIFHPIREDSFQSPVQDINTPPPDSRV
jgi:hypothetical protein